MIQTRMEADGPDDVVVFQLFEQTDLANSGARNALVLRLESDLLQCNDGARVLVESPVHHAIRSYGKSEN